MFASESVNCAAIFTKVFPFATSMASFARTRLSIHPLFFYVYGCHFRLYTYCFLFVHTLSDDIMRA